jgi:hypothetical protein
MKRPSPTIERLIVGGSLVLAFLVMASVFAPDWTQAEPGGVGTADDLPSTDPHADLICLGMIIDDTYEVRIFAGPSEPLYSVYDARSGAEFGVLMTADQVSERFPDLPIPEMDFDTETGGHRISADASTFGDDP